MFKPAVLLRRYKRFLADIRLADGREITVHCPNTGSMRNCVVAGSPCWYSDSESKTRKYPQTLELVTTPGGHLAGINTARANELVRQALVDGVITELTGYGSCLREQVYGCERSRIDFLLRDHAQDGRDCYVEVKSVTLMEAEGEGYFPDAVSERGSKHLRELMGAVAQGQRAVLLFCVQHTGIRRVSPADHIDATYGKTLREAQAAGVEVMAYGAVIDPERSLLVLRQPVPVVV
ncbi:DNA/RNA nuclease SfsA [Cellvibrio japonicus]|uniref:Sugar fermentation stimulation protein homolog n=1 Tax=Cellvibrio japonicus (strain Ueda107) TaxID=498211 RepID=B3PI55_CELJU|nr:DNA/RNA nuclease SfsA [Cellvibrio japonicus]ACE83067.1 sugar fermentation stimulation protein [Cellvibrio japonicus Ueda107]QEI11103.1 DNA/RNA nuclease SfsA [Cellvibrio japonicus]QEI14677.1 DNA/RNA nuclease SfsA [Cellvibrio japonicus]QEI18257.1 DNA/RNA nuclease SfsA [Cellvibrio japonicus]